MSDTTYIDYVQPAVSAEWLNEINDHVWHDTPVMGVTVHDASVIKNTPAGTIASTNIQDAINELDADKLSSLFTQTGTGAIPRSYSSKVGESFSVKDFGAIGDGVADDAGAINTAIAALGYGGELLFPEGIYKCNSTINVPPVLGSQSGLIFTGVGPNSIVQAGAVMASLFNVTGKDVVFNRLCINNASSYATNGILFNFLSSDAAFSAEISDCTIIGFTTGISASGQNYDIQNNFFQNNTTHIYFTNDGRNTSIQDNYFLGGSVGIRLAQVVGGTQAEGTRIVNNTLLCTAVGGAQIQIESGLEIFIGHNIIDQTGDGAVGIYVPVSGVNAVNRLKIVGNWIAGGLNSYCLFAAGNNSDIDIIDNTFAATNGQAVIAGLSLSSTQRAKIAFNNFLLNGGTDVSTSGTSNLKFIENTATGGASIQNSIGPTQFTGLIDTGSTGQIFFPSTQNPSAGANCLDDYEEGSWVPTVTAASGVITTASASGSYTKIGRLVTFYVIISITAAGTGAGSVRFTLPFATSISGIGVGRENGVSGKMLQAILAGSTGSCTDYNNTYPGANGASLLISGSYFTS